MPHEDMLVHVYERVGNNDILVYKSTLSFFDFSAK